MEPFPQQPRRTPRVLFVKRVPRSGTDADADPPESNASSLYVLLATPRLPGCDVLLRSASNMDVAPASNVDVAPASDTRVHVFESNALDSDTLDSTQTAASDLDAPKSASELVSHTVCLPLSNSTPSSASKSSIQKAKHRRVRFVNPCVVPVHGAESSAWRRNWQVVDAAAHAICVSCMGGLGRAKEVRALLASAATQRSISANFITYIVHDLDGKISAFVRFYNAMAKSMKTALFKHAPQARLWHALPETTFCFESLTWMPLSHILPPHLLHCKPVARRDSLSLDLAAQPTPASKTPKHSASHLNVWYCLSPHLRDDVLTAWTLAQEHETSPESKKRKRPKVVASTQSDASVETL